MMHTTAMIRCIILATCLLSRASRACVIAGTDSGYCDETTPNTKTECYDADYRAAELGYSVWAGRTPGKAGTLKSQAGPFPTFLRNSNVTLPNGTVANALRIHDECFGETGLQPDQKLNHSALYAPLSLPPPPSMPMRACRRIGIAPSGTVNLLAAMGVGLTRCFVVGSLPRGRGDLAMMLNPTRSRQDLLPGWGGGGLPGPGAVAG